MDCIKCSQQKVHICHIDKYNGAENYSTIEPSPINKQDNGIIYSNSFSLNNILISRNDIRRAILKLPNSTSCGPDGVPCILFKHCMNELITPLWILWTGSLNTGIIPARLKEAFVIPILKPDGKKSDPSSYRPISLTSNIIKIFERCLKEFLQSHLEYEGHIGDFQHGFHKGRSCLTQLLIYYDQLLNILEEGSNADSLLLDLSKAFDKVDIGILGHRMRDMDITGEVGLWIFNFLNMRSQKVMINDNLSSSSPIISGVPQGTVLGPILFLIYIQSISDMELSSILASFADDSKILHKISNEDDVLSLQDDLNKLFEWEEDSNMAFNLKKFVWVQYGRVHDLKNNYNYFSKDFDQVLTQSQSTRHLGIIINNEPNS